MDDHSRKTIAIVVAAGRGTRVGGEIPKQYQCIAGIPVMQHTLERLAAHPKIDGILPVIAESHSDLFSAMRLDAATEQKLLPPCPGGATRQQSVQHGLEWLQAETPQLVLIHDAARMNFSSPLIDRLLDALITSPGAIPALPLTDTIKQGTANTGVERTVSRENLWSAQTPQAFHYTAILAAHRAAEGLDFTDDAAIAEVANLPVALVEGESANFKITHPDDFARSELHLKTSANQVIQQTISGQGFDVHRLTPGDGVWICGVFIPCPLQAVGHSDADVGLHALTDALLGAMGEGDIGEHFPPTDDRWAGAQSDVFVTHALQLLRPKGGHLIHVDITLICETPKISPHRRAMREHLSTLLGLPLKRVSIKATTTEGLGFTGRREGIAAQAIATISLPEESCD